MNRTAVVSLLTHSLLAHADNLVKMLVFFFSVSMSVYTKRKTEDGGGGYSTLKAVTSSASIWRLLWCPLAGESRVGCPSVCSGQHCWMIWQRTASCWCCCESQSWWALLVKKTARNEMGHHHRVGGANTVSSYKINDETLYWFCLSIGSQCKDFNMQIAIFLSY